MLKTLLVGLDGTPDSEAALELAILLAKERSAHVVGMAVIDEDAILAPAATSLGGGAYRADRDRFLMADVRREVDAILGRFTARCAHEGVAARVLEESGAPAACIQRQAERCDMVFLGRRTRFHFATSRGYCDTGLRVMRSGVRPVVSVPAGPLPPADTLRRALVAYDGSPQATRMLFAWQHLGLAATVESHVVCIGADAKAAAVTADHARDFLETHGSRTVVHHAVPSGQHADQIIALAAELQCGSVVMGAYGNGGLREFFFGSFTRAMLERCRLPLMVHH